MTILEKLEEIKRIKIIYKYLPSEIEKHYPSFAKILEAEYNKIKEAK